MRPTSPKHANVNSATITLSLPTSADAYTAEPPDQTGKNSAAGQSLSREISSANASRFRPRHCPPPYAAGPRLSQP